VKSALSQQRKGLYEDYVGALKDLREYEEISPFQRASLVGQMEEEQPIESLNYGFRFATQPVNISRIVENKPEESFSYSYNPKTGEYKKLPSMAGGGKMMSYYQAGLDFQPKTISRDGSEIPYAQKGTAVSDNTRANIPVRQYVNRETVKSPSNNDWVNNALYAADVATDLMQLGNFVPHPIGQAMGKAGNVAGVWVDGIQAGRDVYRGDLGSAAVNAVSAKLPSIIKNPAIMGGYSRSAKYSFGNRSFYTPVDKRYGTMTKKQLMGNRALLGALGAETVYDSKKKGGKIKKDNAGYWNPENWGKPVEIDSNVITMEGVYQPLLGISDTGDVQIMYPGEDYVFDGESVTEYPMARNGVGVNQADEFPLEKLDNLTNFTNYNNMAKAKKGKKLPKADSGMNAIMRNQLRNPAMTYNQQTPGNMSLNMQNLFTPENIGAGFQAASTIGQNIQKVVGALEQRRDAKQLKALAPVIEEASGTRDIDAQRYLSRQRNQLRPEKRPLSPDQMAFPSYGTGYDVLGMAEDGMQIGGNLTEIQNTYAPNTLYDNLGYEPLDESSRVKQFDNGGNMPKAQLGETLGLINQGLNIAGDITAGLIGIGTKRMNKQSQQMLERAGFQSGMQGLLQNQYSGYMKDGGWVSHDWQPQVIAKFGEYSVKDLLAPPKDADMLRAGGHLKSYTPPSERAMQTYAMGGGLMVEDRGDVEFMGYNPEMAKTGASGYIGISRGPSHDKGGFNIDYNGSKVEVEGGETMLEKGGSVGQDNAMHVLGNMKLEKLGEGMMQGEAKSGTLDKLVKGEKLANMTFKSIGNKVAKEVKRLNKLENKAIDLANSVDGYTSLDKIQLDTANAKLTGAKMGYKDTKNITDNLVALQDAYHETAKEFGYDDETPDFLKNLKKGKLGEAKMGKKVEKAQSGTSTPRQNSIFMMPTLDVIDLSKEGVGIVDYLRHSKRPHSMTARKKLAEEAGITNYKGTAAQNYDLLNHMLRRDTSFIRKDTTPKEEQMSEQFLAENPLPAEKVLTPQERLMASGIGPAQTPYEPLMFAPKGKGKEAAKEAGKASDNMADYAKMIYNEILPYVRPINQLPLSPEQLMGEQFALATNVLEPVQAQTYQPMLETRAPQMTAQAMLNENQAAFNAAQRQVGNNPAALAMLAAQKQDADSKVIAQVEAMNQQQRAATAARNIGVLNDATLKNLEKTKEQFLMSQAAKSATKAQAQAALSSIASKIAQNKLENLTSGVMQNMYNYRFGPKGRIINYNPLADFAIPNIASLSEEQRVALQKQLDDLKGKEKTAKNGSIVKAIKNL
jgi:hypothetical protein